MTARVSFARRAKAAGVALGWILGIVAAGTALSVPAMFAPFPPDSAWRFAWQAVTLALAFFVATWLVGRRFARLSWQELGWHAGRGATARLAAGTGLGLVMAAGAVAVSLVASGAALVPRADWAVARALVLPYAVALLALALLEELLFRGAPLRLVARAVGAWPATLTLGIGFGLAHLPNPAVTAFGTVNIALAAVLLSVAFFSPGGMPLAWGLHFGWNAGLGLVFAAPVSGLPITASALSYTAGQRSWVDGGAFGPEGGLAATVAMLGGMAALLGGRIARPRKWLAP